MSDDGPLSERRPTSARPTGCRSRITMLSLVSAPWGSVMDPLAGGRSRGRRGWETGLRGGFVRGGTIAEDRG